jgi:hypothetical protein
MTRSDIEQRWITLTRTDLPAVASARRWPIQRDHCFQRVLLDNACGGIWYDHIVQRPAYRHADDAVLTTAIALGDAVLSDAQSLSVLNTRSLAWRRAGRRMPSNVGGLL